MSGSLELRILWQRVSIVTLTLVKMHFLRLLALVAPALAAPILQPREDADVIPGQFIVVLKNGASDSLLQSSIDGATSILGGAAPQLVHNLGSFKGFTVSGAESFIDAISNLADVRFGSSS